jgi:hypothetical protein
VSPCEAPRRKELGEAKVATTRPTPVPPSFPRRAKEAHRDEFTLEPSDRPAPEAPDSEVFERATTIPKSPPPELGLELDFSSLPPARRPAPASNPFELGSIPPLLHDGIDFDSPLGQSDAPTRPLIQSGIPTLSPGRKSEPVSIPRSTSDPADRSDRKRTVPEPMVERSIARVESIAPRSPGGERRRPVLEPPDLLDDLASPLGLVDAYQSSAESEHHVSLHHDSPSSVGPDAQPTSVPDMQDRYAVGDFTGALVVAESILDANPDDEDAKRYAQSCREVLTQMYAARIGPMDQIAVVAVPPDQITWLSLDHRAGFLLSLIDGVSSIEEILDISGMTRLDALRIMYTLVQQNVITLHH